MALKDLMAQAVAKYGKTSNTILRPNESTGQSPLELFITDEHTTNYLTLQMAGDADRGGITGMTAGVGSLASLVLALMMILKGRWDLVGLCLFLATSMFFVPFFWKRGSRYHYRYFLIAELKKFISTITVTFTIRRGTIFKQSPVNFK
ncbi:hypothetical protein RHM58_26650 [Pseudomonas sp. 10S4]|uniref:hypothetical protein n=1 Tax=Pseudomonas sp. 10S4 TaxID=3048583 RepID=UPI002AC9C657|nr:hypothetical protein [Pseudomonas sp. 10S4]WPX17427.1 hypothetical protein RHM58_26650 [Pseudomonas sp. 10S4]